MTAGLPGASSADNPQLPFMTRLFGVREIALSAVTLLAVALGAAAAGAVEVEVNAAR